MDCQQIIIFEKTIPLMCEIMKHIIALFYLPKFKMNYMQHNRM